MAQFIYTMQKVRKAHGDKVILDDVTLAFLPGAKIGVVGPNGAGKSSVLKIMAGLDQASNGESRLADGASVGLLQQEPPLDEAKTVRENVEDAVAGLRATLARFEEVSAAMGEPDADFDALLAEQGELMETIEHAEGWELDSRIEQAMDALRCPPGDAAVTHLSGGERRRVALCKLLLEAPDLLLLDEPTNHLDAESVQWLEQHLAKYPGTVLAVTHDRYFLDNVAQWILELDRGRAYPYEGNYSTYLEKKAERLAVTGKKDQKLEKRLRDELEWVRQNAKGRQAKSKARLQRYEEMAAEAEKTRKLDFEEIQIPPGPRLGNVVVEASHLDKGFDGQLLMKDVSFTLPRGGIVGVIGPNGVGKTTLFKMIVGQEKPDSGDLRVGETVSISYVDQNRGGLDPAKNVWEIVSDGLDYIKVGNVEMPSRAYVGAFGFKGPDQQKPSRVLSGGERNRLNLALTLKEGGNVLMLDEPTNDLDVETLGSLENALLDFPGCAVITSHDRWFLDRIATHILAWEGDAENGAKWFWFEGNFESYEKNKIERLGPDAARPHSVTHRKLTRD
ncbi:energy-dependent translational throttle protein EttA [Jatrophihabitans endophyticus]|uniref:energy-dependent translational throttle protein EttA n=1 Tax=Jatrophihabitans endophyticus TaxID=1206085 RepID=UPI0019FCFD36|nr:energy-dependent translational throttle protein EttA [Jatrophihabitans endophyticus]MBE7187611.1 energy-dependent translational throttle protein EttA [Jatrophihabitans endophyticus]